MTEDEIIRDVADLMEPDGLATLVSYRIRLLQIAAYKSFEQTATGHGSAPRYYGMLKLVAANPGVTQTRLAEAIFLDRSSLVPILDTLTREGWIERRKAAQDKRVRRIYLTPGGAAKLTGLEVEIEAHEAMMTAGLSGGEKTQLLALLRRIDTNLRQAHSRPK